MGKTAEHRSASARCFWVTVTPAASAFEPSPGQPLSPSPGPGWSGKLPGMPGPPPSRGAQHPPGCAISSLLSVPSAPTAVLMATEQPASKKSMSADGIPAEPRDTATSEQGDQRIFRYNSGGQTGTGRHCPPRDKAQGWAPHRLRHLLSQKGNSSALIPPKKDALVPKPQQHRGRGEALEQGAISQPDLGLNTAFWGI